MALTPSIMLPLGTAAPDFALPDVITWRTVSLADFTSKKALLVMFICCHCPYVKHLEKALAQLGKGYAGTEAGFVAISSNDAQNYPEDAPEKLKEMARALGFTFPLLYDESQLIARAYAAACTPDFFLFDARQKLVYRGQFDRSRPGGDQPVTGADVRAALDAVLADRPVSATQTPSLGCGIKWR